MTCITIHALNLTEHKYSLQIQQQLQHYCTLQYVWMYLFFHDIQRRLDLTPGWILRILQMTQLGFSKNLHPLTSASHVFLSLFRKGTYLIPKIYTHMWRHTAYNLELATLFCTRLPAENKRLQLAVLAGPIVSLSRLLVVMRTWLPHVARPN